MKNILLTRQGIFSRTFLKVMSPAKYFLDLTNLARLMHGASLSALMLATLLLAACEDRRSVTISGIAEQAPISGIAEQAPLLRADVIRDAYPDDGAVSYILNITKRDTLPNPVLNATAKITTGTCSITPTGSRTLTYNASNQFSDTYKVRYHGINKTPEGDLVGGTCDINFEVVEDRRSVTLSRNITFKSEQAPLLKTDGIGDQTAQTNVPANLNLTLVITAIKRDDSNTPAVTFPTSVVSAGSPSCTATLGGAATKQYSMAAGNLTAMATYNVMPTSPSEVNNCGTFHFNATEGSATGSIDFSKTISFLMDTDGDGFVDIIDSCPMIPNPAQSDLDNDGEGDVCDSDSDSDNDTFVDAFDIDADGDGLIELRTAAQLNMMRNNLGGTGLDADNMDNDTTAGGNSTGCGGGMTASGTNITTCNGYEQMADIDLNDLPKDAATGSNWEPIGTCGSGADCDATTNAQFFSGMFSGNNFTINNMFINVTTTRYGVGFFGAISPTAQVRNVHIRGGNIKVATSEYIGGLVGRGDGATISDSSVTLGEINGTYNIGGLVGRGDGATISNSSVTLGSISGIYNVGGLVGRGDGATINSSVATASSISATTIIGAFIISASNVGGLVGQGDGATISSSVATIGSIITTSIRMSSTVVTAMGSTSNVGGLVGNGNDATISSSVATVGSIIGTTNVGGLVGDGDVATISSSVATVGFISGTARVGGLVGFARFTTVSSSVAVTNNINAIDTVGGLAGVDVRIGSPIVSASYWDSRVSFINPADNTEGSNQTTAALTNQTAFSDIYATWGSAYCNPNTGEYSATEPNPRGDYIRVWDLGDTDEYPAINCIPTFSPSQQRAARSVLAGDPAIGQLAPTVTTDPVDAIAYFFPDDGSVSYTLNITKQDILPNSLFSATSRITTGSCRITPGGVIGQTYDINNQRSLIYTIIFNGGATLGSSCNLQFVVIEDGVPESISRSIIFNAEQAPDLVASLIGSGENILASGQARINVTATKRDGSNTPAVTFPTSVVSTGSPSCTATLDSANSQYSSVGGNLTAVATYNVMPTINGEVSNCGNFIFNAIEGSATGSIDFFETISFLMDTDSDGFVGGLDNCPLIANPGQSDLDNDGEGDVCDMDIDGDSTLNAVDIDYDGDGLIEIRTAAQLNMMRNNLGGTGLDADNMDNDNTAGGNSTGCGGMTASGTNITTCNGYEQMADIDLNDLPKDAATGSNWEPVGTCGDAACSGLSAEFFSGMFSGNNFTISNMFINVTTTRYGVGLFGAISPNAQVHNVHVRGTNITRNTFTISQYVGGLVGWGSEATISNSSVTLGEISGRDDVGGLVGRGDSTTIINSSATLSEVSGLGRNAGGLVGSGQNALISSSVATVGSISGGESVGGLVGNGNGATISSSVATAGSISGRTLDLGGLLGSGQSATISASVATVGSISGNDYVGGLVGRGINALISSSVATVGSISGRDRVGGLAGSRNGATISYSMSVTNSINGTNNVGGLFGDATQSIIIDSYWDAKVSFVNAANNTLSSNQTTAALTNQTAFAGIYATWGSAYCNPNTGEYSATEPNPRGDYIRVWDLGDTDEYPAINCTPTFSPAQQRAAVVLVQNGQSPVGE